MFQMDTVPYRTALVICAGLTLSACGGGGGGGGGSDSSPESSAAELEAGIYQAQVSYSDGRKSKAITYLDSSGNSVSRFGKNELSFSDLSIGDTKINGTPEDYFSPAEDNPDFYMKKQTGGELNGSITSDGEARLEASNSAGDVSAIIRLDRLNSLSNMGISLNDAAGSYMKADGTVTITVASDGSLDAQYPNSGCVLDGSISVPDPAVNLFEINYTLTSCERDERNGDYTGLGNFGPTDEGQFMIFFAQNGSVGLRFEGTR